MPAYTIDANEPILVEFTKAPGVEKVTRGMPPAAPPNIAEKSAQVLSSAMNAIHNMAQRVKGTIDALPDRPDTVEVSFGLKLDAEAGALVARAGTEASINVKLSWKRG